MDTHLKALPGIKTFRIAMQLFSIVCRARGFADWQTSSILIFFTVQFWVLFPWNTLFAFITITCKKCLPVNFSFYLFWTDQFYIIVTCETRSITAAITTCPLFWSWLNLPVRCQAWLPNEASPLSLLGMVRRVKEKPDSTVFRERQILWSRRGNTGWLFWGQKCGFLSPRDEISWICWCCRATQRGAHFAV